VPQDIFLINGTILENIALGIDKKKLDKDRINDIARDTCIIEMFKNSNLNYECLVSDRGLNLSGGQRQRIGIARALYRDPDYLILDEATNQLDNKTKIKILENIKLKYNNITTIIVSHDEDIKKICDNIIILDI
jgi:ATP-binding cassette subfamily B protein